jgi:modulator of FtsH protease HflK
VPGKVSLSSKPRRVAHRLSIFRTLAAPLEPCPFSLLALLRPGHLVVQQQDGRRGRGFMPWNNQDGDGNAGGRQQRSDLEEMLRAKQRKLKSMLPGGSGIPDSVPTIAAVILALVVAFFAFTFRVYPDEVGVVMRFGEVTRQERPGLHFRMPYPIDEVRLPKVTRQNIVQIGLAEGVGVGSMTLTGDENIADVALVVIWRIEDAVKYLFNIQNPDTTVEVVAESAMREVVGQSDLQPLLTVARYRTEQAVLKLMQDVLDRYGAGIRVERVQLLKSDPPAQVLDAFRDVQAATTDKETLQNQASAYAGRVIPEARGEGEAILQRASGYREQAVAEAAGQSARFVKILDEYTKAPDVTRKRLYLEAMERVFSSADKIFIDSDGVVPFLSLAPRRKR